MKYNVKFLNSHNKEVLLFPKHARVFVMMASFTASVKVVQNKLDSVIILRKL